MEKNFKKSDLKTGMRVVCEANVYIVLVGDFETEEYDHQDIMFCSVGEFMDGSSYNDDLVDCEDDEYTIDSIYDSPSNTSPSEMLNPLIKGNLIWKRGYNATS